MQRRPPLLIIKLLSGIALIGSVAWLIAAPDYEPAIAVVTSLAALIAAFVSSKKVNPNPDQTQTVTSGGIGIQAGGSINTGDISTTKSTTNAE